MNFPQRLVLILLLLSAPVRAKEDSNKPHVGSMAPALSPQEAEKRFTVPPGFEVRLFAAEPDVINPVAMSFDEKGRLWIVELYEYPYEKPKNETRKGRDRVICLEDPDGIGHTTKRTVVVEGLWLATAITYGNGGIYVGQAPDVYFYPINETPDGPKAGERKMILTGFGLDDKHELLNSFCWGPDGWLYMTEGVFTHSKVVNPAFPNESPIPFDAGVGRYNPYTKKFEVWADGISNQWGIDWDAAGNAFVSACVIDHIWHVVPGGVYVRQGGTPNVPYTYGLLPAINKDRHHHHMAAYSGINIYQGNLFPAEYRGNAFMGNIHGNCIDRDKLTPDGSSFTATDMRTKTDTGEFLEANDDWFRPVSTQTGPDGAMWIMDWYDKYPCYQNSHAPDLDREKGRIWRLVYVGDEKGKVIPTHQKGMDLGKLADADLMAALNHPNIWQKRIAQRLIIERVREHGMRDLEKKLAPIALSAEAPEGRMAAIWTLGSISSEPFVGVLGDDPNPAVRAWCARFLGEQNPKDKLDGDSRLATPLHLAKDRDPLVLASVAEAAVRLATMDTSRVIAALAGQPGVEKDPQLPFLIWRAIEARIAVNPSENAIVLLNALAVNASESAPQGQFVGKIVRRLIDGHETAAVVMTVQFLNSLTDEQANLIRGGLQGFVDSQQGRGGKRPDGAEALDLVKRQSSPDKSLGAVASKLAALWGNAAAAEMALKPLNDSTANDDDRLKSLALARQLNNDLARKGVLDLLRSDARDSLKLEAVRALSEIGTEDSADAILKSWKSLTPNTRRAAAEVLTTRLTWMKALLKGIEAKNVSTGDVSALAIRTISKQKDEGVQVLLKNTIGRYRPSDANKLSLIAAKQKIMLDGSRIDYEAGHLLVQKNCLVCHSFFGEGMHVGPDLTGVGRSSIDALLHNVIDPNEIIGAGYENTIVETKDGRNLAGRVVENTDDHIKLMSAGDKEDVIAKRDIATMRTEKISVMPEGLVDTLPDADLRNLLWYIFSPPQEHAGKGR